MNKKVAIVGMGWLGQKLATHLKGAGYAVKGSVMTLEKATQLQQRGYDTYRIVISDLGVEGRIHSLLEDIDCAILMIPPGLRRNTGANHFEKLNHLFKEMKKFQVPKVILASSIAVYSDHQGRVTEKDTPEPETTTAKQLLEVENLFLNAEDFKTTVIRFGGMFGGSRQPLRYLAGRKNLKKGRAPVNLINRKDCVGIIQSVLEKDAFGYIFNAVYPEHPQKSEYYIERAKRVGLEPPSFEEYYSMNSYKQVDSENLEKILNYQFIESL